VAALQQAGYFGDGFWSAGQVLRDGAREASWEEDEADAPEYLVRVFQGVHEHDRLIRGRSVAERTKSQHHVRLLGNGSPGSKSRPRKGREHRVRRRERLAQESRLRARSKDRAKR
jgi:hypothetical protein